ncbi:MAG TPA: hypothetical protein VFO34_03500 [Candidatus Acidoferrales bacterium]|nr:hypothetical protein [Candidatus Acidoferrales bacterium]
MAAPEASSFRAMLAQKYLNVKEVFDGKRRSLRMPEVRRAALVRRLIEHAKLATIRLVSDIHSEFGIKLLTLSGS